MIFANRFKGRHAVITGGAAGLGAATASRILAEGGTVETWDIAPDPGLGTTHRQIDVTDQPSVAAAMAEASPDILVCSAGITGPNMPTWEYPIEDWHYVLRLNLDGLFYCNRAAAPAMIERGYGRIVNVASISGKEGNANASAYSTSKAAVIGLTKSLGKELAQTGVVANAVAPAAFDTAMLQQMTPEHVAAMRSKVPMDRFAAPEEVATIVCYLASEEASFTTGAVFDNSGGRATY